MDSCGKDFTDNEKMRGLNLPWEIWEDLPDKVMRTGEKNQPGDDVLVHVCAHVHVHT